MQRHLLTAVAILLVLASAVPAQAGVTRKKAMWGPAEVNGVSQFPIYADLGVGLWQTTIQWNVVAPTRPQNPRNPGDLAYRWPTWLDEAISQAAAEGIKVSITVMFTPGWANGGKDRRWAPDRIADWADFVEAAARRYPTVRHWLIWGEPTQAANFQPLTPDNGRRLRGAALRGPRTYAKLLDASYARLKRQSRRNLVIGGNSFTVGAVAPLRWVKAVKLPNGRPPRMDLWGHNPFGTRSPDLSDGPLGPGLADFNDLDRLARRLDRAMRRSRTKRQKHLKIFISEYALPTGPNDVFNWWVDEKTQARYVRRALKITRRWRRIYTFGWFRLHDYPPQADGREPLWGLLSWDGERKKPAYRAFKRG